MSTRRDKLVLLRKDKDWFQRDVVEHLKVKFGISISESYYGMIEQGVRTPQLRIALAIAELFEINPNEIFFDNKPYKKLGEKTA